MSASHLVEFDPAKQQQMQLELPSRCGQCQGAMATVYGDGFKEVICVPCGIRMRHVFLAGNVAVTRGVDFAEQPPSALPSQGGKVELADLLKLPGGVEQLLDMIASLEKPLYTGEDISPSARLLWRLASQAKERHQVIQTDAPCHDIATFSMNESSEPPNAVREVTVGHSFPTRCNTCDKDMGSEDWMALEGEIVAGVVKCRLWCGECFQKSRPFLPDEAAFLLLK